MGLSALALGAQAVAPIVANGDFATSNTVDTGPWFIGAGSPTFSSGAVSLDIVPYDIDQIYQSVTLNWNTSYTLSFLASGTGTGFVNFYDADVGIRNGALTVFSPLQFNAGSQQFNLFTGPGTGTEFTSHLQFLAGSGMISLDNISITASVPEPESWAMLMAGLAALGALKRRRSTSAA
jgi:hypothetical protein